jgi:putative ABC transport system permease protein
MDRHLLRGALLSEGDIESARLVAVINDTLARNFFGKEDPIGQKIHFKILDEIPETPHAAYFEIVGVVSDAKNRGLQDPVMPEAFLPYTISGFGDRSILVRTSVDPDSILNSFRKEIWAVDRNVALADTGSLRSYLERFSYAQPMFGVASLGVFAGIGLMLVVIGVFSVMAYTVSLQTHEIGIRMALGAQQNNVLSMVLRKGMRLIAAGILIGLLASFGLTRLLASQIWGVSATDPLTFSAVVVIVVAVGLMACLLPARRATQVDPLVALRYE